jgi:hypothetical protein
LAEARIDLLVRSRPRALHALRERLLDAWLRGRPEEPEFVYDAPPALGDIQRELTTIARSAPRLGELGQLYAERAEELIREAEVVSALGSPELRRRARRLYGMSPEEAATARAWAEAWTAQRVPASPRHHRSDDASDPRSLVAQLTLELNRRGIQARIRFSRELASSAATGAGFVVVRANELHREAEASRIALHEVAGHLEPRWNAAREALGIFSVGSAQSGADEEGRALALERDAGFFDAERRFALGQRHLVALAVREGARFVESVELARELGAELPQALDLALRALRGGGLAREAVYLPALARFDAATHAGFAAEEWLKRGRVSLRAAQTLQRVIGR